MRWLLRHSRLLATVLILLVGYTIIGFFLVPYIIKAYVFPAVSERLHRPVLVKEVEVNPFVLSLRVTGFEIREPDQSALLGFDEFFGEFSGGLSSVGPMCSIRFAFSPLCVSQSVKRGESESGRSRAAGC